MCISHFILMSFSKSTVLLVGINVDSGGTQLNTAIWDQCCIWAHKSKRHGHLGQQVCSAMDSTATRAIAQEDRQRRTAQLLQDFHS